MDIPEVKPPAFEPGDIYLANVPNYDEAAGGKPHRVVILSQECYNRGNSLLVVPLTTKRWPEDGQIYGRTRFTLIPGRNNDTGIDKTCCAQGDFLLRIDWTLLLFPKLGQLSHWSLEAVVHAACNLMPPVIETPKAPQ